MCLTSPTKFSPWPRGYLCGQEILSAELCCPPLPLLPAVSFMLRSNQLQMEPAACVWEQCGEMPPKIALLPSPPRRNTGTLNSANKKTKVVSATPLRQDLLVCVGKLSVSGERWGRRERMVRSFPLAWGPQEFTFVAGYPTHQLGTRILPVKTAAKPESCLLRYPTGKYTYTSWPRGCLPNQGGVPSAKRTASYARHLAKQDSGSLDWRARHGPGL